VRTRKIYYCRFAAPGARRIRAGRWAWWITDGLTGPVLAEGTARTEWGAHRALNAALSCSEMATGDCRCDRPVLAPLDQMTAYRLSSRLQRDGVPVTVRVDGPKGAGAVVLWPALALSTEQEVRVLRLVTAATDMPMRWAGVA
jgi:hypothetical protein